MARKIAILRGINVGGKRIIRMEDLKSLFAMMGFNNPQTYIQSGNVLFDSDLQSDIEIANNIEKEIIKKYGFEVPVIVRSAEELETCIVNNPFYSKMETDINKLHITFLKDLPIPGNIQKIKNLQFEPDKFTVEGKHVFIYCEGKYHQTKLNNNFFEKKLETKATTRNLKTVLKLVELSKK